MAGIEPATSCSQNRRATAALRPEAVLVNTMESTIVLRCCYGAVFHIVYEYPRGDSNARTQLRRLVLYPPELRGCTGTIPVGFCSCNQDSAFLAYYPKSRYTNVLTARETSTRNLDLLTSPDRTVFAFSVFVSDQYYLTAVSYTHLTLPTILLV